ncbi:uncharacterized protein LOC120635026 [Pararge aegeria]|uniref:uncharacterized protein LOC120635026 n=1 Tax=Pararge aegeria TaxID=116150 RepID=UPI0019D20D0A|nr:uncharacterized protein LOC120635026 [Pararge aegeria]
MPLDLKVREVCLIENTRFTGATEYLPDDISLERPTPPHLMLHPAERLTFPAQFLVSQDEVERYQSELPTHANHIFTDGSKQEDGTVGAAFVSYCRGRIVANRKYKLHNCCSVFQAELFALLRACSWAATLCDTHTYIYTDSRSAIKAIQDRSNTHPLVADIHRTVHASSGTVQFAWVRSHVGIEGNEAADAAAKTRPVSTRPRLTVTTRYLL